MSMAKLYEQADRIGMTISEDVGGPVFNDSCVHEDSKDEAEKIKAAILNDLEAWKAYNGLAEPPFQDLTYFASTDKCEFVIQKDEALFASYPDTRPPVINGLLRQGETMNIIAATKVGKSWLALGLAYSVANGEEWLGFQTTAGDVLVIDNELHSETLSSRMQTVKSAMGCADESPVYTATIRGSFVGIGDLVLALDPQKLENNKTFSLIIIDALYRMLPPGTSENDNAQMMAIYNDLDALAKRTKSAIAIIHHTSKGNQGEKSVTDVGSGAGSISRAADTHLIIRQHEIADCAVLDARCRSWISPGERTIRWEYPLWHSSDIEPEIRSAKTKMQLKQKADDEEADKKIRQQLERGEKSISELRRLTTMGPDRIKRSLTRLGATSRRRKSRRTGKSSERFSLPKIEAVEWTG